LAASAAAASATFLAVASFRGCAIHLHEHGIINVAAERTFNSFNLAGQNIPDQLA
jgi:hypothetical protein